MMGTILIASIRKCAYVISLTTACLALTPASLGQDSCNDILTSGVHNTYQSVSRDDSKQAYRDALCDQHSSLNSNNHSIDGGASYLGIGANGHVGKSQLSQLQSKYCHDSSSALSNDDFQSLVTQTIDPFIVTNWKECMLRGDRGLFANVDVNDKDLMFTIEWKGFDGVSTAKISGLPQLTGASCASNPLPADFVLQDVTPVTALCHRDSDGAVTFVVNTSAGSKTLKISPITHNTKTAAVRIYKPYDPTMPGSDNLNTVVTRTEYDDHFHFSVELTIPDKPQMPPGFPQVVWSPLRISVYGMQVLGANIQKLPSGTYPTFLESGQPGETSHFEFDVPKQFSDAASGWQIHACIGVTQVCTPTPNLLIGSPL